MLPSLLFLFIYLGALNRHVSGFIYTPAEYHIQKDKGPNRYFRYQTLNGQYRKEKRLRDGSVVGTYGWVDPKGLLRLFDYIADKKGYRVARKRTFNVGPQPTYKKNEPQNVKSPVPSSNKVNVPAEVSTDGLKSDISKPKTSPVHVKIQQVKSPQSKPQSTTTHSSNRTKRPSPSRFTYKSRPRLRPLFVKRTKTKPLTRPSSSYHRRRHNYISTRKRPSYVKQQSLSNSKQDSFLSVKQPSVQQTSLSESQQSILDSSRESIESTEQRITLRKKPEIHSLRPSSITKKQRGAPPDKKVPDFGYNAPGGKVTINFDLGNQYRKEKRFQDGTVVGEHGYVDPFGILRITSYTSGPKGIREAKKSYWVGTRTPGLR